MASLFNLARMTTATVGTGPVTLGAAVSGFITFANAGVTDGLTLSYGIEDNFVNGVPTAREVGRGVYAAAGGTLTRASVLKSTNSNNALNLSGSAQVYITGLAEDFLGGSTGSTDNAVLRADGTGGSTMQASSLVVDDTGALCITGSTDHAVYKNGNYLAFGPTNNTFMGIYFDYIGLGAPIVLGWTNGSGANGQIEAGMTRVGAASIRFGKTPSASPTSYTVTVGEDSRSGTDTNTAGASGVIQSGNGTGTGTPATLALKTPIAVASGSGAQTQTTGLTIKVGTAVLTGYTVTNLPAAATAGGGALAYVTDANATTRLATVAGGGANKVVVFSDGTNWLIL